MTLIMNGISLALYWIGASLINKGTTDFPTISSFMMLASQIIMAFMMLMMMFVLLPRAQVSAERINRVLGTEVSVKDPETDAERTETGTVEFKNVTFRYPDSDEAVIKNISFRANKGDTVAFIGSTGSGKSTLINLVPRFFDVTEGKILIDGVDVREIKQKTLRHIIGYVPQKGVLFTGTVKENIAFGNPALSDEEIVAAAKVAEADDFVSRMERATSRISPKAVKTFRADRSRGFPSRAVAMKPEIFIFDDSFSALDYKTDKKVRENLREAAAGTTKLIVAQRIGTIMDADKIVVLDSGDAVGVVLIKSCWRPVPSIGRSPFPSFRRRSSAYETQSYDARRNNVQGRTVEKLQAPPQSDVPVLRTDCPVGGIYRRFHRSCGAGAAVALQAHRRNHGSCGHAVD
ncbi:MAG: ABC transporter ATP-binding protein [Christensenellaceae bacterium]